MIQCIGIVTGFHKLGIWGLTFEVHNQSEALLLGAQVTTVIITFEASLYGMLKLEVWQRLIKVNKYVNQVGKEDGMFK